MSAKPDFQAVQPNRIETEFDDLARALKAIGPLQQQVQELTERVEHLEEEADSSEAVEEMLGEVASHLHEVEGRVDDVATHVEELDEAYEGLDERLTAIEAMFSDGLLDKQEAHCAAQERPVDDCVGRGDERTIVVEETLYDQPTPCVRGRIDGLQVFVEVDSREYEEGDTVDIVVTDLQDNAANAMER